MPELNRKAFEILQREIGLPEPLRFFSQFGLGSGDHTDERRALVAGLTLDEYRGEIEALRSQSGGKPT